MGSKELKVLLSEQAIITSDIRTYVNYSFIFDKVREAACYRVAPLHLKMNRSRMQLLCRQLFKATGWDYMYKFLNTPPVRLSAGPLVCRSRSVLISHPCSCGVLVRQESTLKFKGLLCLRFWLWDILFKTSCRIVPSSRCRGGVVH